MIILGLDTATEMVSVAVVDGTRVLSVSETLSERRHAEDLTPMIDFVLQRAGLHMRDLAGIAVNIGPGLFTGMRVGVAAAQAIAQVLAVPLVGVDGLETLTAAVSPSAFQHFDVVVPTIDARRREVAWAVHRVQPEIGVLRVDEPRVGSLDDLVLAVRERGQHCLFVGDFALRHRGEIREMIGPQAWTVEFGDDTIRWPHAKQVALLAHARLLRDETLFVSTNAPQVQPMYLREADAQINWATRGAS